MKIGLIDVDGHNFPNLALMRISAYHKARGDEVEWWWTDFIHYDIVYMSKVFSDAYSIYPQYDFAVSMTSRGCPRGCAFCHVAAKEGRCSRKVADVYDFWTPETGKKEIKILDPNLTACREKRDLMRQYLETGCWLDFTQGLDIRCLNDEDINDLNRMKIRRVHFAWDNPQDDLEERFRNFAKKYRKKGSCKTVYCLTNFENVSIKEHIDRALMRIYKLREMNYDPYLMVYDKPHAPKEIRQLQRWCNNKIIFKTVQRFEDYKNI